MLISACLTATAQTPKTVLMNWHPDPNQMGGLSTNDYLTNIVFVIRSSTDIRTTPTTWQVLTNSEASTYTAQILAGAPIAITVNIDSITRFYVANATSKNGGVGPFSNVGVWVPGPPGGAISIVGQ